MNKHWMAWVVSSLAGVLVTLVTVVSRAQSPFPETIALPNGWQPEGIAAGPRGSLFIGSIPTGAVYVANARTGEGGVLVPPHAGRAAIGLKWDRRSDVLHVAGGPTGQVFLYDGSSGADVLSLTATADPTTFVNDVVVTVSAAYYTDSFRPYFYRLPLSRRGRLPQTPALEEIPLTGDFTFVPGEFNANGIVATRGGRRLIIVNSVLGTLYQVDPDSGTATLIDLGGESLLNGDGLLLRGRTLYVVQNRQNQIAAVELSGDLATGTVRAVLTDEDFDVPTTIAALGRSLYAVNARFSTPATPDTEYSVVRVPITPLGSVWRR